MRILIDKLKMNEYVYYSYLNKEHNWNGQRLWANGIVSEDSLIGREKKSITSIILVRISSKKQQLIKK